MSKRSLTYVAFSLLIFFALLWLFSCTHRLQLVEGGRYSDPQGYFELSIPENGWQLLSWKDVDFALWDEDEGATIAITVTPLKEDVELATLARHLLIAFERKRVLSQRAEKINGREALKTVLEGWVEGTEIKAEAYVVKGDGVFYDIIFWAPRETFPRKVEAFHQLLAGITLLKP
jgi:hypothetical protein